MGWFAESIPSPGGPTARLKLTQMKLMTAENGPLIIFIRITQARIAAN